MADGAGTGADAALTAAAFARRMDRLGPFEPQPLLAVGVSGGADSMALVVLAAEWVRARGGAVLALIVDHGLRADSAAEAGWVARGLACLGIEARILTLAGLHNGAGMAARAREARMQALEAACVAAGSLHLLLGHHARDQAETVLMRARALSGPAGLAGMAALRERPCVRLLRPLLDVRPDALRAVLRGRGVAWVEDPSNADVRHERPRLRVARAAQAATADADLLAGVWALGLARADRERTVAAVLAGRGMISTLGYAVLSPGAIMPEALAALWQCVSGRAYPPPARAIAALARQPVAATLHGVRMLQAGRLGPGWLLVREHQPGRCAAEDGARWGGWRLDAPRLAAGLTLAALDPGCAAWRAARLPAAVLRVVPGLFGPEGLIGAPLPGYAAGLPGRLWFAPAVPAAGAAFVVGDCDRVGDA